MEKATNNISDPKVRAYFDDVTEGKTSAINLTPDEYEKGVQQFDEGMRKIIAEANDLPCQVRRSPRSLVVQLYSPKILWQVTWMAHAESKW